MRGSDEFGREEGIQKIMKNTLTVLSFVLASILAGCNTSPEGPLGTDSGAVVPMGDAGPMLASDGGPSPTAWRHCGASGISPVEFRIQVVDATNGPLGACASGWDPIAFALPVSGDIHVTGSDIHQSVRPEWVGREVDFNFVCASDGRYATIAGGSHPSDVNVHVGVRMSATDPWIDVSPSVGTAVSPSGGTLFRVSLCDENLGI